MSGEACCISQVFKSVLEKLFPLEKCAARQLCDLFPVRAPSPASNLSSASVSSSESTERRTPDPPPHLPQALGVYITLARMGSQELEQIAGGEWTRSSMSNNGRDKGQV